MIWALRMWVVMGVPIPGLRTSITWQQRVCGFFRRMLTPRSVRQSALRLLLVAIRTGSQLGWMSRWPGRDVGLPPDVPTLPSLLKKSGYSTTLVGKWHLGLLPKYGPLKSGYDHFYGIRQGAADYYTHSNDLWDDDVRVDQVGYLTDLLGGHAVNVVNSSARSGSPFLLSLHFTAPHWPWKVPEDDSESKRLAGRSLKDFDGGSQKTYELMIEDLDRQVGRVVDAIHANGIAQNTIIIFTSDNGGERFADTWPFTGRKTELLEGGLRIPAIISWPARIPQGRTTNQVGISMDWLPTLLAAAGANPDPAFPPDGTDLLPALTAKAAPIERKLFWRYKSNAQRAARAATNKSVRSWTIRFSSMSLKIRWSGPT